MARIRLGPLLGFEGNFSGHELYTVCFLSDLTVSSPQLCVDGSPPIFFRKMADTPDGRFWRAELPLDPGQTNGFINYQLEDKQQRLVNRHEQSWRFFVPEPDQEPLMAYASCNGYGYRRDAERAQAPFLMWSRMRQMHEEKPFSLLLMGGDQVYADHIWDLGIAPKISRWPRIRKKKREGYQVDETFHNLADRFYQQLYVDQWANQDMAHMMASIPTVMMWDDHDIFDGWGSFPSELQELPLYQALYHYARRYFELFQLRSTENHSLLDHQGDHYNCALTYRSFRILALDQRSRRTMLQIMDQSQWKQLRRWIVDAKDLQNVLVMCAVPVIYRSFAFVEWFFKLTGRIEEFEDDVQDHWSCAEHRGEREEFVKVMLDLAEKSAGKVSILSGDVHVGGAAMIRDLERDLSVLQIISGAIVNKAPGKIPWLLIKTFTSDDRVAYDGGRIQARMFEPRGSGETIRTRNFATLNLSQDGVLQVRWVCESPLEPKYDF